MFRKHLAHSKCSVRVPLPSARLTPHLSDAVRAPSQLQERTGLKELVAKRKKNNPHLIPRLAEVQQDFKNFRKVGYSEIFRQMLLSTTMKKNTAGLAEDFPDTLEFTQTLTHSKFQSENETKQNQESES